MRHSVASALRTKALVALGLAVLSACSSSSTEPEPTTDPHPPGPGMEESAPDPPGVPRGAPAVFISTTQDASVFNDIIGTVIEGNVQNFIQIVPATGQAVLIESNASLSYAESRSTIETFDDGLYIMNVSETNASLRRFDNDDLLDSPPAIPIPTPRAFDSIEEDCFVALGEDIVYKVAWREAPFPGTGFEDGPVVRVSDFFDGGTGLSTLDPGLGGDSPSSGGFGTDACFFNMDFADGVWYDVRNRFAGDALQGLIRDPMTGAPRTTVDVLTSLTSLRTEYALSNLAFDQGRVYYARMRIATKILEVWRKEFGTPVWQGVAQVDLSGMGATSVHSLDVDDGYVGLVVAASGGDLVALWSPDSGMFQLISVGATVRQLQIMYREGDG